MPFFVERGSAASFVHEDLRFRRRIKDAHTFGDTEADAEKVQPSAIAQPSIIAYECSFTIMNDRSFYLNLMPGTAYCQAHQL